MLSKLNAIELDHTAYAVMDLSVALEDLLQIPDSILIRGPLENFSQGVYEAFVKISTGQTIDLLQPLDDTSPVYDAAKKGGVVYQCWRVKDLGYALDQATLAGAKLVVEAKPDPAFFGCKVAFVYHQYYGLVKLLDNKVTSNSMKIQDACIPEVGNDTIIHKLKGIFRNHLNISDDQLISSSMENTMVWDSVCHLSIMLDIESNFSIVLTPEQIQNLNSFSAVLAHLIEVSEL